MARSIHETAPLSLNAMPPTPRVMLLISNLEYGGAQRQVVELANRFNTTGVDTHVVCLSDYTPLARDLQGAATRLHTICKRGKFDGTVIPRLADLMAVLKTDVVHAFLFDAEIAARLAGRLWGRAAVIGSERNTDYRRKWRHTIALRLTAGCVDAVIANSQAGKRFQMRTLGLPDATLYVVRNGIDTERFAPRPADRSTVKLDWPDDAPVVGMFASFKRQKNHAMFFRMARRVLAVHPSTRFLCVGEALHRGLQGSDAYRRSMQTMIESLGLTEAVRCLGNHDDPVDLYNRCDVTVLTSKREGTPNVLLESMACGVPVVATDVADNAIIVPDGHVGHVVPFDDDAAMAARVAALLTHEPRRRAMGSAARRWVQTEFTTQKLADATLAVYRQALSGKRLRPRRPPPPGRGEGEGRRAAVCPPQARRTTGSIR
ncbi:MAG: glycosyltransferase [Phycisphaerae bacterium]